MRNTSGRFAGVARAAIVVAITLGLATPAAAQFGGLKKKLKQAAGQEGANQAAAQATGATPEAAQASSPRAGGAGGQVVLTDDVVKQLLAGLKAGKDERARAAKEDTPYGRYKQSEIAYADAQPKCEAAKQAWPARAAKDEKLMDRYGAMTEKMVNAQQKGDQKLAAIYFDSAMTMMSPSCAVKQPVQPDQYYEVQRVVNNRAEQSEMKASGLSRSELFMAKERAEAILRGATGPDISASEKHAVNSRGDELKRLMGIEQVAPARATKPAPAAAPAPAAGPAGPTVSPGQQAYMNCIAQNVERHQPEIEALAQRAEAARKANDTTTMMAIADSLNQLQTAGCNRDQ
jgi:hypothetical protein